MRIAREALEVREKVKRKLTVVCVIFEKFSRKVPKRRSRDLDRRYPMLRRAEGGSVRN